MKYYKQVGIIASLLLIISCFLPWAYYADLNKSFTGFFSQQNSYGKPGMMFTFIGVASIIFVSLNKIWAKRTHIFFTAINIGYLIKTYILFTSCYNAYCPEKRYGLFLLIISCIALFIVSISPDMKIGVDNKVEDISI